MDIIPLAFSVHSAKGAYAFLLASGASRAAGIPTGHDVMLDLVRRLAASVHADPGSDPLAWYAREFSEQTTYSGVLERIGATPADRSRILASYFEPTSDEREHAHKVPGPAHRAIAELARAGFVRVIVTTNFDQLIESALREAGLRPTVISSGDDVDGMLPLSHIDLVVLKINGDYADMRSLNSASELSTYDARIAHLLDRIVEDFGLIVCGWSAEYDAALRTALLSAQPSRFATYWAQRGTLGVHANAIVTARNAHVITIVDADTFFVELKEAVMALESHDEAVTYSAEVELARTKRYLQDPNRYIDLEELAVGAAARVSRGMASSVFSLGSQPNDANIQGRVAAYESLLASLLPLLGTIAFWARDSQRDVLVRAIARIAPQERAVSGNDMWIDLRWYPTVLCLYACGVSAIAGDKPATVARLLEAGAYQVGEDRVPWIIKAHQWFDQYNAFKALPGLKDKLAPVSEHVFTTIQPVLGAIGIDLSRYPEWFDEWELLLSMSAGALREARGHELRCPMGRFMYRRDALRRMKKAVEEQGAGWPYVQAGMFHENPQVVLRLMEALEAQPEMRAHW